MRNGQRKPRSPQTIVKHVEQEIRTSLARETGQLQAVSAMLHIAASNPTVRQFIDKLLEQGISVRQSHKSAGTLRVTVGWRDHEIELFDNGRVSVSQRQLHFDETNLEIEIAQLQAALENKAMLEYTAQLLVESEQAQLAYHAALAQFPQRLQNHYLWCPA